MRIVKFEADQSRLEEQLAATLQLCWKKCYRMFRRTTHEKHVCEDASQNFANTQMSELGSTRIAEIEMMSLPSVQECVQALKFVHRFLNMLHLLECSSPLRLCHDHRGVHST